MRKLPALLALLVITTCSYAQDSIRKHSLGASLDIYTAHLWRGSKNGTSLSIQPALEYSYGNFSAGAWAAYSIDGSYTELDIYASYTWKHFSITLYDYFCPPNPVKKFEFFEFEQGHTKHTIDLNFEYSQPDKHPLELMVATMVYGDDLNPETGKNYLSTYIEPGIRFTPFNTDIKLMAGFTPVRSYFAEKSAFVNTGISASRNIRIYRKINMPFTVKAMYNPYADAFYFAAGLNF